MLDVVYAMGAKYDVLLKAQVLHKWFVDSRPQQEFGLWGFWGLYSFRIVPNEEW